MLDELSGDDLYAELIMLRTNDSRLFIVVEGAADVAVFDRFVDLDHCVPIASHGKNNARNCLTKVISDSFFGVFAILDKDWLGLLPGELEDDRIVYTDYYDLDACIFFSGDIYAGIAGSFCAGNSFRIGLPGCTTDDLQRACVDMAFPLGVLRYLSARGSYGINLDKFPLTEALRADLTVDLDSLVSIAIARTKGGIESKHPIKERLIQGMSTVDEKARYCSGHDLAKAFSILLKKHWKGKIGAEIVERSARSALSSTELQKWTMYSHAKNWTAGGSKRVWCV